MSLLEVQNLAVDFATEDRKFTAVDQVSFSIDPGECMALVGESGSGKSVTSMSIMRLLNAKTTQLGGRVLFNHDDTSQDLLLSTENEMQKIRGRKIAMIFQEPMTALNPLMKCGEQVAEVIRLHLKLDKKSAYHKTIALFEKVKLPRPNSIYHSYPHQISGGQKQRVMIAMAISCNPSLLIADEPTTALDVTVQKSIIQLLNDLAREQNMSMLFITHDLGIVSEISNKVSVMYKGRIVEQGNTHEIFKNGKHPYTKGLLACRPRLDIRWKRLPTLADFMTSHEDGSITETDYHTVENQPSLMEDEALKSVRLSKIYNEPALVEINQVRKEYAIKNEGWSFKKNRLSAVDNVTLKIYPGEVLGLVGESGCGKSTLGRLVLRLDEISGGSIMYNHQNLSLLSQRQLRGLRKKIQIIFQDPYSSLNPIQRIGESIMEPMLVNKIHQSRVTAKEAVMQLLEKVGLRPEHFNRYPHEFSGGQRQRIVIARALSVNPEFIVCDECVSALDVSVQAQVINLLKELKEERNLTLLFISHDMSVVKYISDRLAVMQSGKIVELGDADEVFKNPQHEYTQHLIRSIPAISS